MSELVKKLVVPPEKRTNDDCELIAGALYVFISSMAQFKDGLCILCQINTALPNFLLYVPMSLISYSPMKNLRSIYEIRCPISGETR